MNFKKILLFSVFFTVFVTSASAKEKKPAQAKWKNDDFSITITENTFEFKKLSTKETLTFLSTLNEDSIQLTSVKANTFADPLNIPQELRYCFDNIPSILSYSVKAEKVSGKDKQKIILLFPYIFGNYRIELYEDTSTKDGIKLGAEILGAAILAAGVVKITDTFTFSEAEFNSLNKKIEKELID